MDGERGEGKGQRRTILASGTGTHARLPRDGEIEAPDGNELAEILHDLKHPLSTIALEVDVMAERIARSGAFDATQSIGRIRRNVTFLDRLIYDLIDACILGNPAFELRRAPCDLGRLLARVIERVVPTPERGRVRLDAGESIEARVDELRIERVIANLLENALKYTPADGEITVGLARDASSAEVWIRDAGPGLSAAEITFVFEPYRRASTARGRPGTGLGLYVSKQIVEAHGGHIGVESEYGAGARFYFALPLG